MKVKEDWVRQEPGWYTSDYGAVVNEIGGWFAYPIGLDDDVSIGPFKSMRAAKAAIQPCSLDDLQRSVR